MNSLKNVLIKICKDKKLAEEFKKSSNLNQFYELCNKIDPNITMDEISENMQKWNQRGRAGNDIRRKNGF